MARLRMSLSVTASAYCGFAEAWAGHEASLSQLVQQFPYAARLLLRGGPPGPCLPSRDPSIRCTPRARRQGASARLRQDSDIFAVSGLRDPACTRYLDGIESFRHYY